MVSLGGIRPPGDTWSILEHWIASFSEGSGAHKSQVFLSVLAMRIVRALGKRHMPVVGLVSLAELPSGHENERNLCISL
jgi:hypothetical protein